MLLGHVTLYSLVTISHADEQWLCFGDHSVSKLHSVFCLEFSMLLLYA